jgi:putative redox protein
MANTVKIQVEKIGHLKLRGSNARGQAIVMDAPESIGGSDDGVRPMEALLMSLAGCSSVDVLTILSKQRQVVESFKVTVEGDRVDSVPAVFEAIRIHFRALGNVDAHKLAEAVQLSAEKYCSVSAMLEKSGIKFQWTSAVT